MKRAYSADPIVLAELAAVLRAIAKQRRHAGRLLRGMANAYEARAVALTPDSAVPQPHY
ncbi:MAG: hypothetical protein KDJ20_15420 [Hyphomicrobiales bacterium]|nr:hypothetical protein [Hyphomicrobiales bacterium]MCC2108811.1 hypothetical protein [Hyphomicrobiales bacterium]